MNILNCHETSPHHSIENSSQLSMLLNEFDFDVGVQQTYLSSFYKIVHDKFKPLFSMSPETIVATSCPLPKLLTFRSSDATMVFMTSVVITTHIANKHMNVKAPPN